MEQVEQIHPIIQLEGAKLQNKNNLNLYRIHSEVNIFKRMSMIILLSSVTTNGSDKMKNHTFRPPFKLSFITGASLFHFLLN